MVAACNDGHGREAFYRWPADAGSPSEVIKKINSVPQNETAADQWEAQILARVLLKCDVILVTDKCDPGLINNMHILHASDLAAALELAERKVGVNAGITVIPDGVSVIVEE